MLTEGIAIAMIIGLKVSDEALFFTAYQRKLLSSGLFTFEPRPYVISVLAKIAKVASKLTISAPNLKDKLVASLVSRVLKSWSEVVGSYQKEIDRATGLFLWVDSSFFIQVAGKFIQNEKRVGTLQKAIRSICGESTSEKYVLRKSEEATMKAAFSAVISKNQIALRPLHNPS